MPTFSIRACGRPAFSLPFRIPNTGSTIPFAVRRSFCLRGFAFSASSGGGGDVNEAILRLLFPGSVRKPEKSPAHRLRRRMFQQFQVLVSVKAGVGYDTLRALAAGFCSQLDHGYQRGVVVAALDHALGHDEVIFRDRYLRRVAQHEPCWCAENWRPDRLWSASAACPEVPARPAWGLRQPLGQQRPTVCPRLRCCRPHRRPSANCVPSAVSGPAADASPNDLVRRSRGLHARCIHSYGSQLPHAILCACTSTCVKQSLMATGCRLRNAFSAQ